MKWARSPPHRPPRHRLARTQRALREPRCTAGDPDPNPHADSGEDATHRQWDADRALRLLGKNRRSRLLAGDSVRSRSRWLVLAVEGDNRLTTRIDVLLSRLR